MSAFRSVVTLAHAAQQREGGGFLVRRAIGSRELPLVDPFLMLDHLGPVTRGPGEHVGAPDHPHRGFETVTYILQGSMQHRDSAGNEGNLTAGMVQWMTAGRGVIHSEMPSDEMQAAGGTLEGFQLWKNLPSDAKMCPPRYQDTPAEALPWVEGDGFRVKVLSGAFGGEASPIETRSPDLYLDVRLEAGASLEVPIPPDMDAFVYAYRGSGVVGGLPSAQQDPSAATEGSAAASPPQDPSASEQGSAAVRLGDTAVLGGGEAVRLRAGAGEGLRAIVVAGVPLREPVVRHGPFVMSTREDLLKAFEDYRDGVLAPSIEDAELRYAATEAARRKQRESGAWDRGADL